MSHKNKTEQSKQYFDRIAERYDTLEVLKKTKNTYECFVSCIKEKGAASILDVGCGTGELLRILSETVPDARLWGMDISDKMLEKAEEKLSGRAELILGDSVSIPLESESCDVICCNHSFHHYPKPLKVLKEFHRVLKDGGLILIGENSYPPVRRMKANLRNISKRCRGDVWFYSKREICWLLSRYFDQIDYKLIDDNSCFIRACK